MRRFWVEKSNFILPNEIEIEGDAFHHICGVCRQGKGSKFEILNGDGKAYFVEIVSVEKKLARAEIREVRELPISQGPRIVLALSIPRFQTIDDVIEKCVELGVDRVQPFVSDFSFVRQVSGISDSKIQRWSKIVQGATRQSGRSTLMPVSPISDLEALLREFNQNNDAVGLFAYEGESALDLKAALEANKKRPFKEIWIFVGSEGGFSAQEVALFQQFGLQTVTMGDQILRVETACIALISVIKYEMNLMS